MILIQNVFLPIDTDFSNIKYLIANYLKCKEEKILRFKLYRKSVDARKKDNIVFCCSFLAELSEKEEKRYILKNKNITQYKVKKYNWKRNVRYNNRPVVVGFGPAGMFAALLLARSGLKPIVIERGEEIEKRTDSVNKFFNGGKLNPESNVQFGEGGAGTFSDGKLTTGIKDFRCKVVLETFVEFGAPEKILYDAKPHIGTDILKNIVKNIRKEIIALGGEVLFSTRLDDIEFNDRVSGVILNDKSRILTENLILATGHSARDIYTMLKNKSVQMVKKPFAVGVRIEHLQKDINSALFGRFAEHSALEPASYKLSVHLNNGRGVYTFCMCPGGEVINASSNEGGLAVNGMSYSLRNGKNANSALLVGVTPDDFKSDDILSGCEFQAEIERKAYNIACGKVPVTTVGNLLYGEEAKFTKVTPTVKPNTVFCSLYDIFPNFIVDSIKEALPLLNKKLNGFANSSAVISAPETRSSAPVRIIRNENYESVSIKGLFPCGEGGGHAGGIVSAAVDGLICAEKLIESLS